MELNTKYGPVMWYDGIDPAGPEQWKETTECTAAPRSLSDCYRKLKT